MQKKLMVLLSILKINMGLFRFPQWKEYLKTRASHDQYHAFSKSDQAQVPNILVIDRHIPFFDKDAGSYRLYNLLKIFSDLGYNVTFIGADLQHYEQYDTIVEQSGIHVLYFPLIRSIKQYLSQYGHTFSLVILSRPHIADKYFKYIRTYCGRAKIIYDTVDLHFLRHLRQAQIENNPRLIKRANELKELELKIVKSSDVVWVVSAHEKEILLAEYPLLDVHVISVIYNSALLVKDYGQRKNILFLGDFSHSPNIDGVEWFIQDIFPKIKQELQDITFFIVGNNPTREIRELSCEDVIVTGFIHDLTGFLNDCRVFVAPLRYGAGVKGKIVHSMSHGLPVVTTSIGAEGMDIVDGKNVLISDDPGDFSQKVLQLYQNEEMWKIISQNSLEYVEGHYSYEISKNIIRNALESLQ